ncbi:MAG: hypothetical protein M1457_08740, partial [bacterium]|nr:hypothetical protein [bacterium]
REISERIDLMIPTASTQPEQARWRSQVPGSAGTFAWTPGDYGENTFIFRSSLERGDRPNTGELRVGGDFSVLAYIITQSAGPEAERRRWPVKFGITPEGGQLQYKVNFVFVLDQPMPSLPDWADVTRWTK